ncbi:hypothetical protein BD311DRAFT_365860 [Dichomitus squalens]|uniref:Uncharacterized protein n=1 Tax=Dichomitus squalens TaxID=114155 RepID=A0A4Q9MLU4_9APHY|nr:hypothetical protein BD311DRAFT_365860 [Dichomitus squalens]
MGTGREVIAWALMGSGTHPFPKKASIHDATLFFRGWRCKRLPTTERWNIPGRCLRKPTLLWKPGSSSRRYTDQHRALVPPRKNGELDGIDIRTPRESCCTLTLSLLHFPFLVVRSRRPLPSFLHSQLVCLCCSSCSDSTASSVSSAVQHYQSRPLLISSVLNTSRC